MQAILPSEKRFESEMTMATSQYTSINPVSQAQLGVLSALGGLRPNGGYVTTKVTEYTKASTDRDVCRLATK